MPLSLSHYYLTQLFYQNERASYGPFHRASDFMLNNVTMNNIVNQGSAGGRTGGHNLLHNS